MEDRARQTLQAYKLKKLVSKSPKKLKEKSENNLIKRNYSSNNLVKAKTFIDQTRNSQSNQKTLEIQ